MTDFLDEVIACMVQERVHFAVAHDLVQFSEARREFDEKKEAGR